MNDLIAIAWEYEYEDEAEQACWLWPITDTAYSVLDMEFKNQGSVHLYEGEWYSNDMLGNKICVGSSRSLAALAVLNFSDFGTV
jgi:hypothetical protein